MSNSSPRAATLVPQPLFRDPIFDGAADPTIVWNRGEGTWWMLYTNRRAWSPPSSDVAWVHGTDIGIASSRDGGATWDYRGIVPGLDLSPGRNTYWAPEVFDDGVTYHMYVTVIEGVPRQWEGTPRTISHYTSRDLWEWTFASHLELSSPRVIDACVSPLPSGGWRMWYKDEENGSHTYAADSADLYDWCSIGAAVVSSEHEGPNVFRLDGWFWMIVDEWAGLRVLRSDDLETWEVQDRILDEPGAGAEDGTIGQHADVVVVGDDAYVFYFTHPGRTGSPSPADEEGHATRRSSIQVARARVVDGRLVCDRNERLVAPILPIGGPSDAN
ncbi:hypothetical protein ACH3VR_21655 [Microbacterium sp. B2969]|uniref:Glycosyl hydrolase n=1 Tax=Microbacterium alkaliflavum TaxID=3248839 RepID=A0ABW7QDL2_9MICO